ncbi:hypothetical protein OG963_44160 (plasmid) [Streptomyces sp. NBC_01707]|uniref:hypothetical protein n=1 Tax=Streptomyces sp. NBC_01707 TaxID=2975914 RepID=UPI00352F7436
MFKQRAIATITLAVIATAGMATSASATNEVTATQRVTPAIANAWFHLSDWPSMAACIKEGDRVVNEGEWNAYKCEFLDYGRYGLFGARF